MGILDGLFRKKPAADTKGSLTPKQETGSVRESMLREEAAAMAMVDFDEAAKTLTALYEKWLAAKPGAGNAHWDLVGGYNYIAGKKDGCWTVNQYLSGNKDYDAKRIQEKVDYHKGFPGDDLHRGSREVLEWAAARVNTDVKPR